MAPSCTHVTLHENLFIFAVVLMTIYYIFHTRQDIVKVELEQCPSLVRPIITLNGSQYTRVIHHFQEVPFIIQPTASLPFGCLDRFMATGYPCRTESQKPLVVVYKWNSELRRSLRSTLRHLESVKKIVVFTPDIEDPIGYDEGNELRFVSQSRLGLIPNWFNSTYSTAVNGETKLQFVHNADLSANASLSIEHEVYKLCDIPEVAVYMDGDMFLSEDLGASDFYTPTHGPVFRFSQVLETSQLLDERFGERARPQLLDMPRTIQTPILHEIDYAFEGEHDSLSTYPTYVVERWREALLWSWFVAKIGGINDEWDAEKAWSRLGGEHGELEVAGWLERDTLLRHEDDGEIRMTKYRFSSQDGYPFSYEVDGKVTIPDFQDPAKVSSCIISKACVEGATASGAFVHAAFAQPQCGDCILRKLVAQSGRRGLDAFLPSPNRLVALSEDDANGRPSGVPHLPLSSSYRDVDYTLLDVLAPWGVSYSAINVRQWMIHALHRYRFVLGTTEVAFGSGERVDQGVSERNFEDRWGDNAALV